MDQTKENRYINSFNSLKEKNRFETSFRAKQFLVKGIWLYILLLFFEGALRKWVVPSLATPLLIVRDPVAIALILYAWYHNLFPRNIYIILMAIIMVISIITTLTLGHGNVYVTFYGARLFLIHFPVVFIIGSILNRDDVLKVGRVVLWLSLPMTVLVVLQFYSPQSAWVNRGVGGDLDGAGFGGAMGYFRPPGTFSFTNGLVSFFSLAAAYILYFWLRPGQIRKSILIASTIGLILVLPLSISRTLWYTLLVMLLFMLMTLTRNPKYLGKILVGFVGISVLVFLLSKMGFLDTPMEVLLGRFDEAADTEGGVGGTIGERYLGNMYWAIVDASQRPFFGEGLGMGTQAGSSMLGAEGEFLIAEDEWPRVVGEMGAILGIGVIAIRVIITAKVGLASYLQIRNGKVLSWMLLSFAALMFPQGVWAQPTMLGFGVLSMGLTIASFNEPKLDSEGISNKEEISRG